MLTQFIHTEVSLNSQLNDINRCVLLGISIILLIGGGKREEAPWWRLIGGGDDDMGLMAMGGLLSLGGRLFMTHVM